MSTFKNLQLVSCGMILITSILLLAGCGGGGGDAGLSILSTNPSSGAVNADPAGVITVTFSQEILSTSIDTSSFTLQDNQGSVSGAVSYDSASNTASFTPAKPLGLLRKYTATLTTAIADLNGNHLTANYVWTFTTQDGAWQTAHLLENIWGGARSPQVAVDAKGNAVAVWRQYDGVENDIFANRYDAVSGWGVPEVIDTQSGDPDFPQIAMDAMGNATAVWYQSDGARNNIWANHYSVGGGWGAAELIETNNAGNAIDPQVAMDAMGNAMAVWYQSDGVRTNIWANQYGVGSGWGVAELIENDNTGSAKGPQIAVNALGDAMAVWYQSDGARNNIWANRFRMGSGWGVAELVENDNVGNAEDPQIALDNAGNAIAVWRQADYKSYENILANRYEAGVGWGVPELIETISTGNAFKPQVAFDAAGNTLAVWEQFDGAHLSICANRRHADSGWGTAEMIEAHNSGHAKEPQIAMDMAGNAIAVWHQHDGALNNICANRYHADNGWGVAELIENDNTGSAKGPQIGVDGAGNAIAVWYQFDGKCDNICANLFQ